METNQTQSNAAGGTDRPNQASTMAPAITRHAKKPPRKADADDGELGGGDTVPFVTGGGAIAGGGDVEEFPAAGGASAGGGEVEEFPAAGGASAGGGDVEEFPAAGGASAGGGDVEEFPAAAGAGGGDALGFGPLSWPDAFF